MNNFIDEVQVKIELHKRAIEELEASIAHYRNYEKISSQLNIQSFNTDSSNVVGEDLVVENEKEESNEEPQYIPVNVNKECIEEVYSWGKQYSLGKYVGKDGNVSYFEIAHKIDAITVYGGNHNLKNDITKALVESDIDINFNIRNFAGRFFEDKTGRVQEVREGFMEGYVRISRDNGSIEDICFVRNMKHPFDRIAICKLDKRLDIAKGTGRKSKYKVTEEKRIIEAANKLINKAFGWEKEEISIPINDATVTTDTINDVVVTTDTVKVDATNQTVATPYKNKVNPFFNSIEEREERDKASLFLNQD